ncbi:MAG: protein-disulfide reductase DsbD domain-containing protein [Verrucomicrobiota bacterium]
MISRLRFISLLGLIFLTMLSARSSERTEPGITLHLISDHTAISPGASFWVALQIDLEPGWHSYWKHPGIVGLPFGVEWHLPPGFEAGPLLWAPPQKVKMGPYTAYGYRQQALLLTQMSAPRSLSPGSAAPLLASLTWMACSNTEGCYPSNGERTLLMPVHKEKTRSAHASDVEKAQARLPQPLPLSKWDSHVDRGNEEEIILRLQPRSSDGFPSATADYYFFSDDAQVHSDRPQSWKIGEDGSLTLRLITTEFAPHDPKALSGLLYHSQGWPCLDGNPFAQVSAPWPRP